MLEISVDAAYVVTPKYGFLGPLSKFVSQMEAFFTTVLHLCLPKIPSWKNSQSLDWLTNLKKEVRFFVSHRLKYQLLRVTCHFQGLYSEFM